MFKTAAASSSNHDGQSLTNSSGRGITRMALQKCDVDDLESLKTVSARSNLVEKASASRTNSSGAGFIVDPEGPATHDETTVDIVTIPCPGGHPLKSWSRDGLIGRCFGAPSMREAEVERTDTSPAPSWVRQGIRRQADKARILLYEHPGIDENTTLSNLADEMLQKLSDQRKQENSHRPLFFISHSIGGLIAKMALARAARDSRYRSILRDCYGIAFFGTPHQGSSYFAMPGLSAGIQKLLQLSQPLPPVLIDDLRIGNEFLLHLDDDFKSISTDLKIWTFYETIDSRLGSTDAYITAPLTSIKSAILGMRQERIMPLQSDHANIASFGRHNVHMLDLFLQQLSFQIRRADKNTRDAVSRDSLNLEQKVSVEVHGFFQDPPGPEVIDAASIRAWSTRLPLKDFLQKGPDGCLSDRLSEVQTPPEPEQLLDSRGRPSVVDGDTTPHSVETGSSKNLLGIHTHQPVDTPSPPESLRLRPMRVSGKPRTESAPVVPGKAVVPHERPLSPFSHHSTPMQRPSPLIRADFDQDLAIDRLSPLTRATELGSLNRTLSNGSAVEYRDFPPFSQRSLSNPDLAMSEEGEQNLDDSPPLPEAIVPIRKTMKAGKTGRDETVVLDEVVVAFTKPDVHARKFTWIHLPYNNPTWVKEMFASIELAYQTDYSALHNNNFWASKHTRGRHSQHYAYHAKPGCFYTGGPPLLLRTQSVKRPSDSLQGMGDSMNTCVFLPYLHFDTYKCLVRRRELTLQRLAHGRAHPVPENVAQSDSLEHQIIWEFLGHDPPVNLRRTLDQYRYPALRDTRTRDDDQMLYKLTKERDSVPGQARDFYSQGSSGRPPSHTGSWRKNILEAARRAGNNDADVRPGAQVLNGNVLMVDQLWLWILGSHTVLTCFPKRQSDPIEGPLYQQADLRESIFHEVNVDVTRQCENSFDLAALSVLHAASVLLDRSSHPDLEVFRIFEEAISVLTENLTSSLKAFRAEGFRDKASDYEPVENKERSIRARHKAEGRRAEAENRDNTSALLELRDIEDELLILLHLFDQQMKVVSSMDATFTRPELREQTINARVFLNEALRKLGEYTRQAEEMVARVRGTRDDYDKLLQMVQRQAQVDEVRLSRLHADLASAQSRSVLIFTTFTVIFLPLSFFTGLFGMNTQEWGGEGNLPLKTIGAISLPASAFLIVFSLVIAWSTNVRKLFLWLGRVWNEWVRRFYQEAWRPLVLATWGSRTKKTAARRMNEEAERRLKKEASDFWERHRLERERGYQIPAVNMTDHARAGPNVKGKKEGRYA